MISDEQIFELLRVKSDGSLFHRESKDLEFKEQFNFSGLAEYFKDFAAFANNNGGYMIFGITNSPRKLVGLSKKSLDQFSKIDPEKISGYLLDIFAPDIDWSQTIVEQKGKSFGVFYISESKLKPIIAKKDEGRDQLIKNGDIFYRYGGRSQKIQQAELQKIIQKIIDSNNQDWSNLIAKISKIGPVNAAILDTEKGLIEKDAQQILVIDEELTKKIKFIKEGKFSKKEGSTTLKLVGDVHPIDSMEVSRVIKKNLLELYPLSFKELMNAIKACVSDVKERQVHEIIKENNLKNNPDYSSYNFRNRNQEVEFQEKGKIPSGIPSIYNEDCLKLICHLLKENT
jgi:hypothetical protein